MLFSNEWSFYNPVKINFGVKALEKLPDLINARKGLLVTTPGFTRRGLTERLSPILADYEIEILDQVEPNPDFKDIEAYRQRYQDQGFQFVVGVGGGSVLDTAKALGYLLNIKDPGFSLQGHFEDKLILPDITPLEMIAVPTTAGTGSEVTPFATIWDMEKQKKYSLQRPDLYYNTALLDPELTVDLPIDITIVTGLDALSHALESIWNRNANDLSLSFAVTAVEHVLGTLPSLVQDPANLEYRSKMMAASLLGGLSISTTRTALAHSISYPITAAVGMPHGLACSFTLPALLEFNAGTDDGRIEMVTRKLGFGSSVKLQEALLDLFEVLNIKELFESYGLNKKMMIDMIPRMFTPERAGNNLRDVGNEDVKDVLIASYDILT